MRAGGDRKIIFERGRPDERHPKLETKVKAQDARFAALELALGKAEEEREKDRKTLNELLQRVTDSEKKQSTVNIQQLRGIIANLENTISAMVLVEEYEVVGGTLKAFNDRIYDLRREGLTHQEKQILKTNGLLNILHLLNYKPKFELDDPNATPVEQAFRTAEGLLTSEEWDLCYHLQAHRETLRDPRNNAQHPRPDRSTAQRWLTRIAPGHQDTFTNLLDSNPLRMRTSEDDDSNDLRIVVGDGEYDGPEAQQALLAQLRDTLEEMQREEAARVGNKRKRIEP
ncbi:hypothetical protein B0H19DRAFT_1251566 [Mycena capillaripes]|nr:hypothetical protein B0H19DRAFT_1251566 [Mycena capillaripes]